MILDGENVDNDESFTNEYGDIMYPGDPSADPVNIFNCRCTLIASIKGFDRDVSDIGKRNDKLEDMSYADWKAGHYEQRSDSITKQDDIAETMKWAYGKEYTEYRSLPDSEEEIPENQSNIEFDFKGKEEKFEQSKELILELESEYQTRLQKVTVGAEKAAGTVDMSGATLKKINSNAPEVALHEFAHTLADSSADKYGLTHDEEFWKEIRAIRNKYHRDVDQDQDTSRWISTYEHSNKSIDEFMCDAFTHAKAKELGLSLSDKYGNDYTYSDQVLDTVNKYFGKQDLSNSGNDVI